MLEKETSLYFNLAKFEHAQRIATLFSSSTMVPKHFQGNVANCLIALNYADRLQADPFMVMQNMYVVHGRPGVEAKLVIALINQSGKYAEPLKFKFDGAGDEYGCTAWTREEKSQEIVEGPKVTLRMVKAEGWNEDKKNRETGYVQKSKWNTMPEMMYRYRAASYFANVHCPELKLGMSTVEEIRDFVEMQETGNGKFTPVEEHKEPAPPIEFNDKPEQDQKPKRTRRTKAEIEAAAAGVEQAPAPVDTEPEKEPDREPGDEGQAAVDISPEQSELDALKAELKDLETSKRYYVLEAKKRTGIAMPQSIDGYNELIKMVWLIVNEKK
jgi:hypothetical protein